MKLTFDELEKYLIEISFDYCEYVDADNSERKEAYSIEQIYKCIKQDKTKNGKTVEYHLEEIKGIHLQNHTSLVKDHTNYQKVRMLNIQNGLPINNIKVSQSPIKSLTDEEKIEILREKIITLKEKMTDTADYTFIHNEIDKFKTYNYTTEEIIKNFHKAYIKILK